jgi:hypothetical protein
VNVTYTLNAALDFLSDQIADARDAGNVDEIAAAEAAYDEVNDVYQRALALGGRAQESVQFVEQQVTA